MLGHKIQDRPEIRRALLFSMISLSSFGVPDKTALPGCTRSEYENEGTGDSDCNLFFGTANYLMQVNHYDDYGRVIKTFKQHFASSAVDSLNYDETINAYSFAGELKSSTRVHYKRGASNTTIAMAYEYDAWGRKVKTREKINANSQVLLSENRYNEIGG